MSDELNIWHERDLRSHIEYNRAATTDADQFALLCGVVQIMLRGSPQYTQQQVFEYLRNPAHLLIDKKSGS